LEELTFSTDIARKTISGRGVLLDWAAWASSQQIDFDPFSRLPREIPLSELLAVAAAQNTTFHTGDILIIRTGWLAAFARLDQEQKAQLPRRATRSSIGVEASTDVMKWHWDNAFAAVASDTVAYEAWPSPRRNEFGLSLHEIFLAGWGCPIGESFDLEKLALKCQELHRWTFFFCSTPLYVAGGVASPPGAVAIL
jgi:kynurenine formamidase